MAEEKEKSEQSAADRKVHAKELRNQVHEKETEKIMARKAFFEEGFTLRQEAKERFVNCKVLIYRISIGYTPRARLLWHSVAKSKP